MVHPGDLRPAAADAEDECKRVGLCADCVHAKKIRSERGSEFILCQLSPAIAISQSIRAFQLQCSGYEKSMTTV